MTGEVESKRIDIEALGLKPLALKNMGEWNPKKEYWGEKEEQKDPASQYLYLKPIIDYGVRPSYEMEQIIPSPTMEPENIDIDSDPIIEAAEYHKKSARTMNQNPQFVENVMNFAEKINYIG